MHVSHFFDTKGTKQQHQQQQQQNHHNKKNTYKVKNEKEQSRTTGMLKQTAATTI